MDLSLAVVIFAGLFADYLFQKLKLAGVAGMLLVGILSGPYILNLIPQSAVVVAADFRKLALAAILLRAIFELQRGTLKRAILPTLLIATVPTIFEISCIIFLAHLWLHLGWLEASILGIVLSAVSLTVLVHALVTLKDRGKGEIKSISDIVLGSACLNNIFVIVIFTIYMGLYSAREITLVSILGGIPVPIILGILLGLGSGYCFYRLSYKYKSFFTSTRAAILILGFTFVLVQIEDLLHNIIPVASLLGVLVMGVIILEKAEAMVPAISQAFDKGWIFAELLLFVSIGAQVNIHVVWGTSLVGLGIIACGLTVRSMATNFSIQGYGINQKQRAFCIACNLPKATVQAAIAAIPMEAGVPGGDIILAISVLAILVTTLIGAPGINLTAEPLLAPRKTSISRLTNTLERIPPIGKSIRSKKDGTVWEIINEDKPTEKRGIRETEAELIPAIKLTLYQPPMNHSFGEGKYITLILTDGDSFNDEWEILPDFSEKYH